MRRLDISTGVQFDEIRAAFEKAAPAFDLMALVWILAEGGGWKRCGQRRP
jgi:hypothetical protein